MIKIDLNKKAVALNWEEEQQDNWYYYILISILLSQQTHWDPIKLYNMAKKVYNDKVFEWEKEDVDLLMAIIEKANWAAILKWQILEYINWCLK